MLTVELERWMHETPSSLFATALGSRFPGEGLGETLSGRAVGTCA